MSETATFEIGERIAVWAYATGHKALVSIVTAEPWRAQIEIGPQGKRHREWTTYDKLTRRSDGEQLTYAMVIEGLALRRQRSPEPSAPGRPEEPKE